MIKTSRIFLFQSILKSLTGWSDNCVMHFLSKDQSFRSKKIKQKADYLNKLVICLVTNNLNSFE